MADEFARERRTAAASNRSPKASGFFLSELRITPIGDDKSDGTAGAVSAFSVSNRARPSSFFVVFN